MLNQQSNDVLIEWIDELTMISLKMKKKKTLENYNFVALKFVIADDVTDISINHPSNFRF